MIRSEDIFRWFLSEEIKNYYHTDEVPNTIYGDYNSFIEFIENTHIFNDYICLKGYDYAVVFIQILLYHFKIKDASISEVYNIIKLNADHEQKKISNWEKHEIDLLNDNSTICKLLCYSSEYKIIDKFGDELRHRIHRILFYKDNIIWINRPEPKYFFLYKEKIYGISYTHKEIEIYKNIENNPDSILIDNDQVLDDIIKNNDTQYEREVINLTKYFPFSFFRKGFLYNVDWKREISVMKNIEYFNSLLQIEIENLTYPHTGYALLDIEQCKIIEANKIYDPEEPQPAFKPKDSHA